VSACLALTLSAGAAGARAEPPLALDPSAAAQSTALLVTADESVLSPNGQSADSITFALARGIRIDSAARERLCGRDQAERAACPVSSRIGFGRFVVAVRGFLFGGGEAELAWSLAAYLGEPLEPGDAASVVLIGNLLGADSVAALLAPALDASIPSKTTTVGRLVRRASGAYGIELRFAKLPVQLPVAAPITAAPARLDMALSAVRRTRQNFIRRIKVRTPSGYEIRKIPDHRLIGHYLFRTPPSCNGSWPSEVRVGFTGRVKRTTSRIACLAAGSGTPSAARRRVGPSSR
jgi:hypothetical protein